MPRFPNTNAMRWIHKCGIVGSERWVNSAKELLTEDWWCFLFLHQSELLLPWFLRKQICHQAKDNLHFMLNYCEKDKSKLIVWRHLCWACQIVFIGFSVFFNVFKHYGRIWYQNLTYSIYMTWQANIFLRKKGLIMVI